MPATADKTETKNHELKPITPEARECLMKYFGAKPPEKPLNEKEFNSIKDYLGRSRGGLSREAYQMVKEDKELVKAAAISQVHKDHRIMERRTPEIRDTLLKILRSGPGEKNLSLPEFKQVAVFLDQKNGGIRRHAFRLFKDDKEVLQAAEKNRAMKQEVAVSKDKSKNNGKDGSLEKVKRDTVKAIDAVRSRRSPQASVGHSTGHEPGE